MKALGKNLILIAFIMGLCSFVKGDPSQTSIQISQVNNQHDHIETGILPADAPDVWYDSDLNAVIIYGWGVVASYDVQVVDSANVLVADETISGSVYEYVMLPSSTATGIATVTIDTPWGKDCGEFYKLRNMA